MMRLLSEECVYLPSMLQCCCNDIAIVASSKNAGPLITQLWVCSEWSTATVSYRTLLFQTSLEPLLKKKPDSWVVPGHIGLKASSSLL